MLLGKRYFLFHAQAFNDVIKFKTEISKFEYLKNKKSFSSEIKNIFLSFKSAYF